MDPSENRHEVGRGELRPPMHLHFPLKSVFSLNQKLSAIEGLVGVGHCFAWQGYLSLLAIDNEIMIMR